MKKKNNTNTQRKRIANDDLLALVDEELAGVIALYDQLVEQSDKLAAAMGNSDDWVLGKVMPSRACDRRDSARISKWMDGCREEVANQLRRREEARSHHEAREKLLAELNLTDEQKALLFEG